MQCGTPVIASDCTSIPEVAGEAAQLINPEDIKGWAKAMFCSYTDKNIRTRYKTKGEQNLLRFSWEKCARETMDVFNEVFSLSKTQKEGKTIDK
jgi:glycosyltransferase involved in cell wall biosynthesis